MRVDPFSRQPPPPVARKSGGLRRYGMAMRGLRRALKPKWEWAQPAPNRKTRPNSRKKRRDRYWARLNSVNVGEFVPEETR